MKRVLVCGGRWWNDQARVDAVLDQLHAEIGIAVLIQGGQQTTVRRDGQMVSFGADYQAKVWAEKRGVLCIKEPAHWDVHGKAAGSIRNSRMLRLHKPDLGVAFPGQNGTFDMVSKMRAAGVPVYEVPREDYASYQLETSCSHVSGVDGAAGK
jgi:YspA, cpYpsA-related SLOG family